MTTVQIVGIAVAAAVVVLLVIALLVTRRRSERREQPPDAPAGSFLDEAPKDSLARLGKPVQPVEDVTLDPEAHRDVPTAPADTAPPADDPSLADHRAPVKDKGSDDMPDSPAPDEGSPTSADQDVGAEAPAPAQAAEADRPEATPAPSAGAPSAPPTGARSQSMPLSDIIVTTSNKMVNLQDPEVRRMLTDLVTFEIDQATQFRQQGQTIDAVLQLTEAEKISRALGMHESAEHIHEMMKEMRAQT